MLVAHDSAEKWIHLSDLHFGTETPAVCEALRALVESENPSGLIISGDVTQRAKQREFTAAASFLTELTQGRRLLVVPGNHDVPLFRIMERVLDPYQGFERAFGPIERVSVVDEGQFRFVLLNTTRSSRHKLGTLDEDQIQQVAQAFIDAPQGSVRAVVLHHPLPAFDDTGQRFVGDYATMHVAERAVRIWAEAGLDLAFCGHTHHPRVLRLTQANAPVLPPTLAEFPQSLHAEPTLLSSRATVARRTPWLIQAGTSLSRRLRSEPNSLHVVVSTPAQPSPHLRLERWDFSVNTLKFERISQVLLN